MDIISHALWTNLIFKEIPLEQRYFAIGFGVLPDLISFSGITGKAFIIKIFHYTDPPLHKFPKFVFQLYNFTHSLVIWLGLFLLCKFILPAWGAIVFCGWGLHILLDIFTHRSDYFPTPILWPFSNFHFSGISWSNKWFMLFNYAVILFMYLMFYF